MGLLNDLKSIEKYETSSLPELVSRVEQKNVNDLKYLNEKYAKEFATYRDVPADMLEEELNEVGSLVEMSYIMRKYPEEYEKYASSGKHYNANDPYSPFTDEEEDGVPSEILKVMSEPDNYEAFK